MTIYNLFALLGGLAFFLFGMNVMSSYLEKLAGGKLEGILQKMTANPLSSLLLGTVITIAIQSSSALTVMLVGLVNSGIMELSQTVCVIMGSDIGTTLTAWILSLNGIQSDNIILSLLKPANFSLIVAFIGVLMVMASKSQKKKDIGTILCGFAVLMYGMSLMSSSVAPLAEMPQFQKLLIAFDNPILALLVGVAFTGVIQSSAASIGVLQALSLTGSINFGMALPLVMGANIGTCVTALLSGLGVSKKAKRVPAIHIIIKVLGVVLWMVLYVILRYLLRLPFFDARITAFQIAIFHTIFNIGTVLVLLPFAQKIVKLAERVIPLDEEPEEAFAALDERLLLSPGLAVSECRSRAIDMANLARESFYQALGIFDDYDTEAIAQVIQMEEELDFLEDDLNNFMLRLSSKELSESDNYKISEMLHTITDFERIGDHAINMTDLASEMRALDVIFSGDAKEEIVVLDRAVREILNIAMDCFINDDKIRALQVEPLEEVIDGMVVEIKNRHIARLRRGECKAELGITLNDYLTNCERVSDHCSNIAISIIQAGNSVYDPHSYLISLKTDDSSDFNKEYERFNEIFRLP